MGQTCPGFAEYKALYPYSTQCWGDTSKVPTVSRAGRGERRGHQRRSGLAFWGRAGANQVYPVQIKNKS